MWRLDANNGETRTFDTRAEAEATKADLEELGLSIELPHEPGTQTVSDGGEVAAPDNEQVMGMDVCVHCGNDIDGGLCPDCDESLVADEETVAHQANASVNAIESVKESGLDTDPLSVLPGFMVDSIQGAQAVNKRGYAMIAERYGIGVTTEMVQSPWDNEEGRVVCKATATTDDDKTYTAYGTACAADGDDSANLIELADTRSQKRAIQWASGYGIVGYQELTGQLEGGDA